MKLPFGNIQGKAIHISEVASGKTIAICPYCKAPLIAKKGKIKRHHFAHQGESCSQQFATHFFALTDRLPTNLALSTYAQQKLIKIDNFHRKLSEINTVNQQNANKENQFLPNLKQELDLLLPTEKKTINKQLIDQTKRFLQYKIAPFPEFHLIRSSNAKIYTDGTYKCHFADMTFDQHEFFYPQSLQKFVQYLKEYHSQYINKKETAHKLVLFEKDFFYFKKFTLYFIEIEADHQKIFKIGLTSRALEKRMQEIQKDLKQYFLQIKINILFRQAGVAFLETFFKQKFTNNQLKMGQLTEYFTFSEKEKTIILKDLKLLKYLPNQPNRNDPAWIDWVYFNFNGKIYGYQEKSVYINREKIVLAHHEVKRLEQLI